MAAFAISVATLAVPLTVSAAGDSTSRLVPVAPCTLVEDLPVSTTPVDVLVVGVCSIPAGATGAAVTITVWGSTVRAHLTAYRSGATVPETSTLNVVSGRRITNGALLGLGENGAIALRASAPLRARVDVTGYFVAAPTATSGRFVPLDAVRLIDTRNGGRPVAGGSVRIDASTFVPAEATAAVVNLTTTATSAPGRFAVYPSGTAPSTISLSVDAPGQTRAVSSVVPLANAGFSVFTSAGDHVIVDLVGYFTGADAPETSTGLFVSQAPVRLVDTRRPEGPGGGPRLYAGGGREFAVASLLGPTAAVVANVTVVGPDDRGHWKTYSAGVAPGAVSSVNASGLADVIANMSVTRTSEAGIGIFGTTSTHIVIDITGYFTGDPVAATLPPPPNAPVLVAVSDSQPAAGLFHVAGVPVPAGTAYVRYSNIARSIQTGIAAHSPGHLNFWFRAPAAAGTTLTVRLQALDLSGAVIAELGRISLTTGSQLLPLPARSGSGRRIVVDTRAQQMWLVESDGRVSATFLMSGRRIPTASGYDPRGTFSVYSKSYQMWYSEGSRSGTAYYMTRWQRTVSSVGSHSLPIENGVVIQSEADLGWPLSSGCARLARARAEQVYRWAAIGTTVVVVGD